MMDKVKQQCDSCRFWQRGDPAHQAINAGLCVGLLWHEGDLTPAAPFWAVKLTAVTTNWEGHGCSYWTARAPTVRDLIAPAAEASEAFGDDECEAFAAELRRRRP